jgi:hypothetical protein
MPSTSKVQKAKKSLSRTKRKHSSSSSSSSSSSVSSDDEIELTNGDQQVDIPELSIGDHVYAQVENTLATVGSLTSLAPRLQ